MTSIMFGLQVLANILSWYLIERFGRRALLLTGLTVIIVSYFIIGGLGTSDTYMLGVLPKVIVAFMVIITVAAQLSISSVYAGSIPLGAEIDLTRNNSVWAIVGEASCLELRASTQSLAIAFNSTIGFGFAFSIPYILVSHIA